MGCCYDERRERKRIEELAKKYEAATGEKMVVVKRVTGEKVWWDFVPEEERDLKI
jgi:hypothetical protein